VIDPLTSLPLWDKDEGDHSDHLLLSTLGLCDFCAFCGKKFIKTDNSLRKQNPNIEFPDKQEIKNSKACLVPR
jgi:hypothetical protein